MIFSWPKACTIKLFITTFNYVPWWAGVLVVASRLQPRLIFTGKDRARWLYPKHFPANIWLGWKWLTVSNALAYYSTEFKKFLSTFVSPGTKCHLVLDNLQLKVQYLGRVFNSKSGCVCAIHSCCYWAKLPNLKMKACIRNDISKIKTVRRYKMSWNVILFNYY